MMVSVILVTYNHERYIEQALDSILSQEAPFEFEVLVSEDCSTDRTREIVSHYSRLYPNRIRLFLSERNLNTNEVTLRALRAARGTYVAFLDGDDYWASREKLARQVLFLQSHPEYALCFHDVMQFWENGSRSPELFNSKKQAQTSCIDEIMAHNFIAGCSAMIRRSALSSIPSWFEHCLYGDWPLYVFAAQHGPIGFIPEAMGAYRIHKDGIWSGATAVQQWKGLIEFSDYLQQYLGPPYQRALVRLTAYRYSELAFAHLRCADYGRATQALLRSLRMAIEWLSIARRDGQLVRMVLKELWGRPGKRFPIFRLLVRRALSVRLGRPLLRRRSTAG